MRTATDRRSPAGDAGSAVTRRLIVLPAAPVLLPGLAQVAPEGVAEVLAACDEVLGAGVASAREVAIVSAADHPRDLMPTGPVPPPRAEAVADSLLDRVGYGGVRLQLRPRQRDREATTWLLMTDGSAAVGPKSPRPGPAGPTLDEALMQWLVDGELGRLMTVSDSQAQTAGCLTASVWRRLGELGGARATCESMSTFAPFGVRYFVGSWTTEAGTR